MFVWVCSDLLACKCPDMGTRSSVRATGPLKYECSPCQFPRPHASVRPTAGNSYAALTTNKTQMPCPSIRRRLLCRDRLFQHSVVSSGRARVSFNYSASIGERSSAISVCVCMCVVVGGSGSVTALGHYGDHPRPRAADRGTPSRKVKRVAPDKEGAADKQCLGDIITLENTLDLYYICIAVSRKKHFTHSCKIYLPHLNNVLTLPCENETITFHTHNALLEYKKRGSTFVIITLETLDKFYISGNRNECPMQAFSNVCTKPEFMTLMSCDRSAVCEAYIRAVAD